MGSQSSSSSPSPNPPGEGRNTSNPRNAAAGGRNYVAVARGSDLVVIRVVGKGNMLNAPALADFAEEQRRAGFTRFLFDMERCEGLDSTFMGVMVGMHAALASDSGRMPKVVVSDDPKPKPPQDEPAARKAVTGGQEMTPLSPQEALKELEERFHGKPDAEPEAPAQPTVESEETALSGVISAVNVPKPVRDLMSMLGVDKFVKPRGTCDLAQLETTILPEKNLPPNERRKLILKAHETLVDIDKRNEAQFGAFLKALSSELGKE
jgi:anti-anti-sigma regulatory factor